MKLTKRICALLLCALMLSSLCACGNDDPDSSANGETVTYQVTVVDGLDQPYTEKVIVKFMQNGTQVAMATVDANGIAQKDLPKGDYNLEIDTAESGMACWYDKEQAVVSADVTEVRVTMAYEVSGDVSTLTANVPGTETSKEYQAYLVTGGSVYVPLTTGDRTYVIFTPFRGGMYEFSVFGDARLGYYGAPHYVQAQSLGEVVDNRCSVSVANSSISTDQTGTARLVIGLDAAEGTEGVILNIQRTGDNPWTIEDEPWLTYQAKREITPYTLPDGVSLRTFELSAPTFAYQLVLNETDRCYHLNTADGPLVFVQLEKEVHGISLKNMVGEIIYQDGVLMQSGTAPFRYMYNNGQEDFFKEDYTDVLRQYVTQRDQQHGVYPMTEDLYYILSKGIEFIGWCNPDSTNYLFAEKPGFNPELTWLFLCEFVDQGQVVLPLPEEPTVPGTTDPGYTNPGTTNPGTTDPGYTNPGYTDPGTSNSGTTNSGSTGIKVPSNPIHDNKSTPEEVGGTLQFSTKQIQPGHLYYYALYKVTDTILRIENSNAYVIYKGKTYTPVNGVVTVPDLYSSSPNVPVKLSIGNLGSSAQSFNVNLRYLMGHRMNPFDLGLGSQLTYSAEGNSQGVYYTYQASKSGTLTVRLDGVSGGNSGNITITSEQIEGGTKSVNLTENANSDGCSVSFKMSAGERVSVNIGVMPSSGNVYPEATISTTVSFS